MREYRVYALDYRGAIHTPHDLFAEDDADAFSRALELAGYNGCEIWNRDRLVGRIPGTAPTSRPAIGRPGQRIATSGCQDGEQQEADRSYSS